MGSGGKFDPDLLRLCCSTEPPDRSNTPKDPSPVLARAFRAADQPAAEIIGALRAARD